MKWWTIIWSSCRVFAKPYNLLLLATLALTFFLHRQVAEHLQNVCSVSTFWQLILVDFHKFQQLGSARNALAAARVEALEAGKIVSDIATSLRAKGVRP